MTQQLLNPYHQKALRPFFLIVKMLYLLLYFLTDIICGMYKYAPTSSGIGVIFL